MNPKITNQPKELKVILVELTEKRRYKIGREIATTQRTFCGPLAVVKASVALFKLGADETMSGWKIRRCALTKKSGGLGHLTVTYAVKIDAGARAALSKLTGKPNRNPQG